MSRNQSRFNRFWFPFVMLFLVVTLCCPSTTVFAKNNKNHHNNHHHKHGKGQLDTLVHIKQGMIEGFEDESDTWSWQGIPFAKPPVGDLRWKAPQPPEHWNGVRETQEYCDKCAQVLNGEFSGSEDCLYLNIWRPATQQHNLPVYVYIHGGSNLTGSASDALYYGARLASNANMVVVTINYRLGALGWFIDESLDDGNPLNGSGNYGLLDIIQALKWVKGNIKEFGGNPRNVSIAGQSAGGFNVCALLISPEAKGLFNKAISQSGGLSIRSIEEGLLNSGNIITDIINGDPDADPEDFNDPYELPALAEYLREKSAEDILFYQSGAMRTTVDGVVVHSDGAAAFNNPENYNQVPTILGTNKEEYKTFMIQLYGNVPDPIYQMVAESLSMGWRQTGVDDIASAISVHESQPGVYAYSFDYGAYHAEGFNAWPTQVEWPNPSGDYANFAIMIGAGHGFDIPFFFNNWEAYPANHLIFSDTNYPGYELLSESMVKYIAFFTRTGIPNDPGGTVWEPWSNEEGGPKRILLDADESQALIEMSFE